MFKGKVLMHLTQVSGASNGAQQHSERSSFAVRLLLPRDAVEHLVQYVELIQDGARHRIESHDELTLSDFFDPDFGMFLVQLVGRVGEKTSVYSDSSISYLTFDCSLENAQINAFQLADGGIQFNVKFTRFKGSLNNIVKNCTNRVKTEPQAIAIEALERVVGRAYDLALLQSSEPDAKRDRAEARACLEAIASKRDELLGRLQLLDRAIRCVD